MSFLTNEENFLLPVLGLLAAGTLIIKKPSLSAILLFLQAIGISFFLGLSQGLTSEAFGTSILLSFFTMILIGINLYFEASFTITHTKTPTVNLITGLLLIVIFINKIYPFLMQNIKHNKIDHYSFDHDIFTMIISGFSLFSILVASIIIFEFKTPRSGD
jgi:hypothetical protein